MSLPFTVDQSTHENPVEWGYLLLEHTPVRFQGSRVRPNRWYTVHLALSSDDKEERPVENDNNNNQSTAFESEQEVDASGDPTLTIPWRPLTFAKVPPHDGASTESSDGLLLLGFLHILRNEIQIVQSRILFLDDSLQMAAFYVTLGFSQLGRDKMGRRSLTSSSSQKPLHPAWQVVLSLLRSDWNELETLQTFLQDKRVTRSPRQLSTTTLFPPKFTMEVLYRRIQASPFEQEKRQRRLDQQLAVQQQGGLGLTMGEIWQRHVTPFCTAADLDNLRATCGYLHGLLEEVVPGLKLSLYQHQITSLTWMRRREKHELTESDCCADTGVSAQASGSDGDLHRAVTGGQTVLLRPRNPSDEKSWRVDSMTGREYLADVSPSMAQPRRRVCRGGLLIDEPGLGKTITVLALILQTAGLSTESTIQQVLQQEDGAEDQLLFDSYWQESVPADFRRHDLLKLVNRVGKRAPQGFISLAEVKKRIDADFYAGEFDSFEKDVESAILDKKKSEDDLQFAAYLIDHSRELVGAYKARMLASAKKSFSNPLAKPNSNLASLIEESKRLKFVKSLVSSRGTLVVIPSVLMDHWESQIDLHIDMKYLCPNKIPMVYAFGGDGISLNSAEELIRNGKFEPVVFLDRGGTKTLPPAEFLAQFLIVITTTSRFSQEWKNGSFQEEVERCADGAPERLFENTLDRTAAEVCPLLKIHWLRMIIDEGHSMGKGALSSSIQFASWISSERRWAMTGTPTKEGSTALTQIRNLMRFLQHDFFTPRGNGELVWSRYISRPWKEGKLTNKEKLNGNSQIFSANANRVAGGFAAFFRLRALLKLLMKRHTKRDIVELALPIQEDSYVSMSHVEVNTYNSLVTAIQTNLLLTSMKEDAQQDSLLHRSQARFAREALRNVRSVCVGFSRVIPTLNEKIWLETEGLMHRYSLTQEMQNRIKKFMQEAEMGKLTPCDCCGLELSMLLVVPCCGGLVCTECMDGQSSIQYHNDRSEEWMHKPYDDSKRKQRSSRKYYKKECLLCEGFFDVDNLQRLQPGFLFTWLDNLKADAMKQNADGEMPSAATSQSGTVDGVSDHIHQENRDTANGEGIRDQMIIRPPAQRRRTKKPGDGHECEYDRYSTDGKCIHCLEEHSSCNLLRSTRCSVCFRPAIECPQEETKSSYLVNKCLSLVEGGQPVHRDISRRDERPRPIKIIVFSQFRKALNLVGSRLLQRFGTACISEYWGRYRTQELHKFTHDPECFCMLLGRDGSEGLDLSFVTHIFFLEQIWDQSLADQTIARAWRMGASGPVEVETIIARDTVEEAMQAYEAGNLSVRDLPQVKQEAKPEDQQQRKAHVLLKSLRFITDYHYGLKGNRTRDTPQALSSIPRQSLVKFPPKAEPSSLPPAKRRKVTFVD